MFCFDTYESGTRLANFGAIIPEKLICFSGGGAPTAALMVTESPEWIWKFKGAAANVLCAHYQSISPHGITKNPYVRLPTGQIWLRSKCVFLNKRVVNNTAEERWKARENGGNGRVFLPV